MAKSEDLELAGEAVDLMRAQIGDQHPTYVFEFIRFLCRCLRTPGEEFYGPMNYKSPPHIAAMEIACFLHHLTETKLFAKHEDLYERSMAELETTLESVDRDLYIHVVARLPDPIRKRLVPEADMDRLNTIDW